LIMPHSLKKLGKFSGLNIMKAADKGHRF